MTDFYHSSNPRLWNGLLLLAIDGSKAEVPYSSENREGFGKSNNQHLELGQVRALVSCMYDILNQFYLDIEISHISTSETELAPQKNLNHFMHTDIKQPVLAIFDRGYPSIKFIDFGETEKKYHTLKNKMKFENVTGKSTIYVEQGFRTKYWHIIWYRISIKLTMRWYL